MDPDETYCSEIEKISRHAKTAHRKKENYGRSKKHSQVETWSDEDDEPNKLKSENVHIDNTIISRGSPNIFEIFHKNTTIDSINLYKNDYDINLALSEPSRTSDKNINYNCEEQLNILRNNFCEKITLAKTENVPNSEDRNQGILLKHLDKSDQSLEDAFNLDRLYSNTLKFYENFEIDSVIGNSQELISEINQNTGKHDCSFKTSEDEEVQSYDSGKKDLNTDEKHYCLNNTHIDNLSKILNVDKEYLQSQIESITNNDDEDYSVISGSQSPKKFGYSKKI